MYIVLAFFLFIASQGKITRREWQLSHFFFQKKKMEGVAAVSPFFFSRKDYKEWLCSESTYGIATGTKLTRLV